MGIGVLLTAPDGYLSMRKGVPYSVLRNDQALDRVLMVALIDNAGKRRRHAELIILSRALFETGLLPSAGGRPPAIAVASQQNRLPPWLAKLEGTSLDLMEGVGFPRPGKDHCAKDEVEARMIIVQPALDSINAILSSAHPDRALNKFATSHNPPINETRFRLWFYSYVACGNNIWALCPPRYGEPWDRLDPRYAASWPGKQPETDESRQFRYRTTQDMVDKIVKGFESFASPSLTFHEIWSLTIRKVFGGEVKRELDARGWVNWVAIHTSGAAMPSFNKFYYYCHKVLGKDKVRKALYPDEYMAMNEVPVGPQQMRRFPNIGDQASMDTTHIKDLPRSHFSGASLPPMQLTILADATSRNIDGVGFTMGSEDSRGYLRAFFCAAICKVKFGQIIGFPIKQEDWPSKGLPSHVRADRGAGSSKEVSDVLATFNIKIEMSPSRNPKANAASETKNKRRKRKVATNTFRQSNLTPTPMTHREVRQVITKNGSDDIIDGLPGAAIMAGVSCPRDYWLYHNRLFRTSLIDIPFDVAVRKFLDVVTFKVKAGRLYLQGREYTAEAVATSGLASAIHRAKGMELKGYLLLPFTKMAWIEFNGALVEVEVCPTTDAHEGLLSYAEAEELAEKRSALSGKRQRRKPLEVMAGQQDFFEHAGVEMHAGVTKTGRPKFKTAEARDETKRLMHPS